MVTNSLRLEDIRWDEVKDLIRIQNQNGIKQNRMGQDETGVFQLQIRYLNGCVGSSPSPGTALTNSKRPLNIRSLSIDY